MKVGIIGGTGKMGRLFTGVFERAGHEVGVCGKTSPATCEELARASDLVLVAVPVRDTVTVIGHLAPLLTPGQIFCDLTSLKTAPVAAMMESAASVIGLHPMFGPGVISIRGQTIVATPARCSRETLHAVLSIFEGEGAAITITTPEEHDRIMALVQGLTHSVTLVVADTMRRLSVTPEVTAPFMSPVYQIEMGLVGRLLSQDPALYGDMLMLNPNVPSVLAACEEALEDLRRIITTGDAGAFSDLFVRNAVHFGSYCDKAAAETDYLIRAMVNR